MNVCQILDQLEVEYTKHTHPAVYTCEQAAELAPNLPGTDTKNLFLRDSKGRRHFLVVVSPDKAVDLKQLSAVLETSKLSFASPERLQRHLGIDPGCVSLLALANDKDVAVELVIDERIWQADSIQCHPLVNTETLVMSHEGVERFLAHTGHQTKVVEIPSR